MLPFIDGTVNANYSADNGLFGLVGQKKNFPIVVLNMKIQLKVTCLLSFQNETISFCQKVLSWFTFIKSLKSTSSLIKKLQYTFGNWVMVKHEKYFCNRMSREMKFYFYNATVFKHLLRIRTLTVHNLVILY